MATDAPLTLSRFQQILGETIRSNPMLQSVWLMAELSDVRSSGGHCYMELVEKDASGATVAKMRANIWASTFRQLYMKFLNSTGRQISTGMKVMVRGSATHHSVYGFSFNIVDIDPFYTLGDIERIRREILERLAREGVLEQNRQLRFPDLPQRIAVISSGGAAGFGDFMNQIEHNPEGFVFYPLLVPAMMQGERTAGSVCSALDFVESTIDMWDCVVIIRGGGATTDLNGFDNYELARRVATFPLPVMVGIGHERDRTVLDEIACVRCKTPTAVAAALCDRLRESYARVVDSVRRIARYSGDRLQGEQRRIANAEAMLPMKVRNRLMRANKQLDDCAHAVERAVSRRFLTEERSLSMLKMRYQKALENFTERPAMRLKNIENMLRVLSPENTLKRGFSVTRVNGKAVRSSEGLPAGTVLETQLASGTLRSEIL